MTDKTKVEVGIDIVESLTDEELNQLVDFIRDEYKTRARKRNARAKAQMTKGTRVRLAGNRKPAYLSGMTGTIEEVRQTRVLVKLDEGPVGKFRSGKVLTAAGSLEMI